MNQNKNTDKKTMPPSNMLAEEIVAGHLLSEIAAREYIFKNVTGNFFALQKYQILYFHMLRINKKHSIAETINELWRQKLLKKIGGISHILHIIHKSQGILSQYRNYIHIEYFIKILHHNYIKRLFIQYSYSILQLSHFYKISIRQIYNKANKYLSTISKRRNTENCTGFQDSVSCFLRGINQSANKETKISSGFRDLDGLTNGFKGGELIIIAGRPSMGKTSLAINIAYNAIFSLKSEVQIFSLEMSKNEILDKLIALASNISIQKIQQKVIQKYEWVKIQEACRFLILSPLWINDRGSSSIEYIKKQCLNHISKKNYSYY